MAKAITNKNVIDNLVIWRMVEKIVPSPKGFKKALLFSKRLKIYFGIDPTSPELHLGHVPGMLFLRQMQKLGHETILLLGDFTAMIGDPTGKDTARKPLSRSEVLRNLRLYRGQLSRILDLSSKKNPTKILFNSRWLAKLTLSQIINVASRFTVQQLLERDMFSRRIAAKRPIGLHEFIYPILQGYDSVFMDVDVEVGGSDQLFNMLIGRKLLSDLKKKEKFVVALRLLINPKTGKKMSKTEGNYIALTYEPERMYGAIMALPDEFLFECFELCTEVAQKKIDSFKKALKEKRIHPKELKAMLAQEIVTLVWGKRAAKKAKEEFERVFVKKEVPRVVKKIIVKRGIAFRAIDFLFKYGLAKSKSEAKRLIEEGAVKVANKTEKDWKAVWRFFAETLIRIGKKKFLLVKVEK
ncbi:MAG: tyrosine--tRNA ligase [Candidatus Paceibacteria bacterium]